MESRWEKASQFPHPPSTVVFADFATEFAICSVVTYYRCAAVVVDDKSITDVRSITTQKRRFKVVKPHFRIVRISVQHTVSTWMKGRNSLNYQVNQLSSRECHD